MGLPKPLRGALAGLFGSKAHIETLRLHVESELGTLLLVSNVAEAINAPINPPGVISRLSSSEHILENDLVKVLRGRVGGRNQPEWADGTGGAPEFGVSLCRVKDAIYTPGFGAVITNDGSALLSSVAEALYYTKDLAALPGVEMVDGAPIMSLRLPLKTIPKATVFMAWGGRYNYGHFLLDCLSALCAVADEGLLNRYPAIAPNLTPWHRELLQLMLGEDAANIIEVEDDVVKVRDVIFTTPMDHFLHAPSRLIDKVRSRILSRAPVGEPGPERIYLSRRKDEKRPMLNELELERRLDVLGFEIVHPEDLSVLDQVSLFRHAKVVVGATGAAFANCLFSPLGAKVFEVQPSNYTGIWTRGLCHQVGVDWFGYFAPSPSDSPAARHVVREQAGAMFAWTLAVDDFIRFLESGLDAETNVAAPSAA